MRQGYGRVAVLLDRSGSMGQIRQATVDGYNEFVSGQKAAPGTAVLALVQFDDQYEPVYEMPVADIRPMTLDEFVPRGTTALYDAMGRLISDLGASIAAMPESDRPDSVTFVVITDGKNNASMKFNQGKIAEMVERQTKVYNWKFVFLGANQDAVLTGATMSIPAGQSLQYANSTEGVRSTFRAASAYTVRNRSVGAMGQAAGFSVDERSEAMDEKPDPPKPTRAA